MRDLKDMGLTKELGIDGFPIIIYQICWHIMGKEFSSYWLGVLNNDLNLEHINVINIALIPKIPNLTSIVNFKPISFYI